MCSVGSGFTSVATASPVSVSPVLLWGAEIHVIIKCRGIFYLTCLSGYVFY